MRTHPHRGICLRLCCIGREAMSWHAAGDQQCRTPIKSRLENAVAQQHAKQMWGVFTHRGDQGMCIIMRPWCVRVWPVCIMWCVVW
jgi:hypothetical protein